MGSEHKPIPFDADAIRASWNAIFEEPKVTLKAKPKPKPVAKVVPKQSIEVVRKTVQQSVEQLAQREREEAERLKAEARQREEVRAQYQAALDAQAYRNLAEREIARAWDPQGLWGPMTLASKLD